MRNGLVGAFLLERFSCRPSIRGAAMRRGSGVIRKIWLEDLTIIAIPGRSLLNFLLLRTEERVFIIFEILLLSVSPGWRPHRPFGAQVRLAGLFRV